MAKFSQRGLFLLTFFALLNSVMAATLDGDLIGVIVATVCVVLLLFAIIALASYCGFRYLERSRRRTKERKHSGVSTSTTPRWAPPMVPSAMMPVYTMPEPMMYAMPHNYYLGHYTPKYMDADAFEHMSRERQERERTEEEYSWRSMREQEAQEQEVQVQEKQMDIHSNGQQEEKVTTTTTTLIVETTPIIEVPPPEPEPQQPNGHVVQEFSQSSSNYKVIRKQHKHEKMPEWLTKDYDENEMSMDVGEEASISSSDTGSTKRLVTSDSTPVQAVKAQVSPKNSTLDSDEVMHVSPDYTIVDYVDPEQPNVSSTTTTAYRVSSNDESTASGGFRVTTTELVTTTTTHQVVDTSHESSSTYIPPASTSTPRAPPVPPPPPPPPPPMGLARKGSDSDDEHYRMRRRGQGSVEDLPQADVQF